MGNLHVSEGSPKIRSVGVERGALVISLSVIRPDEKETNDRQAERPKKYDHLPGHTGHYKQTAREHHKAHAQTAAERSAVDSSFLPALGLGPREVERGRAQGELSERIGFVPSICGVK